MCGTAQDYPAPPNGAGGFLESGYKHVTPSGVKARCDLFVPFYYSYRGLKPRSE